MTFCTVLFPKQLFDKVPNDSTWTLLLGKQLEYVGLGVAYVTVCNGMEWMEWMEWNGMEWNGIVILVSCNVTVV